MCLKEENTIKDIRDLFTLKSKELNHTEIKDIRNFLRQKKTEAIKDRMLRNIKDFFEHEEKENYKPVRVNNFWSINYIEYESNGDRTKVSIKKR